MGTDNSDLSVRPAASIAIECEGRAKVLSEDDVPRYTEPGHDTSCWPLYELCVPAVRPCRRQIREADRQMR